MVARHVGAQKSVAGGTRRDCDWRRMNVHHLELFYYVARHGGISRAVRHIPYGIQQPAVSSQILMLEQDLGKKLFARNPFKLTGEGEKLFEFVRPFFENLGCIAAELRREAAPQVRIGASEIVLRDHLPHLLSRVQAAHPRLRITLRSGFQVQMEAALQEQEIDLAITPLENRPPPKLRCLRLVRLPLVLLAPRKLNLKSAEELWAGGEVEHPLITLPPSETVCRNFRKGLQQRRVDWPMRMEASSLDLITRYVANGYGIGLSVNAGEIVKHPRVTVLELPDFEPIVLTALWRGTLTPLMEEILRGMQEYARKLWPAWCCERDAQGFAKSV